MYVEEFLDNWTTLHENNKNHPLSQRRSRYMCQVKTKSSRNCMSKRPAIAIGHIFKVPTLYVTNFTPYER